MVFDVVTKGIEFVPCVCISILLVAIVNQTSV